MPTAVGAAAPVYSVEEGFVEVTAAEDQVLVGTRVVESLIELEGLDEDAGRTDDAEEPLAALDDFVVTGLTVDPVAALVDVDVDMVGDNDGEDDDVLMEELAGFFDDDDDGLDVEHGVVTIDVTVAVAVTVEVERETTVFGDVVAVLQLEEPHPSAKELPCC